MWVSAQARPSRRGAPIGPVDDSDRVVLRHNVHALARPGFDSGRSNPERPMNRMMLTLAPPPEAQTELDELLARQHDPASAEFHHWLTPEEFGSRFGRTAEEVGAVTDWLSAHGFRIDEVARAGGWISFSGTARAVERAFATEIHEYHVGGKVRFGNATDPSIPRALSGVVGGIVSLHNFPRHPQISRSRRLAAGELDPQFTGGGGNHYLAPADFATIYGLNAAYGAGNNGTGETIAIVGRSDIQVSDVQTFRNSYLPGLPLNFVVTHNGPAPGDLGGDEETEADLDVQWAGAVAPRATLKFVVSQSGATDGVDLSAAYIVNNNVAPVMSTSFGSCEAVMGAGELSFFSNLWAQAAAQGITSFVASGDAGAAGCEGGGDTFGSSRAVSGLCSTPYNVCVGGTQFADTLNPSAYWLATNNSATGASVRSYIPEVAWNESGSVSGGSDLWSSGGGASSVYAKPSWQSAPGVPADGRRDVPDVALTSAGHDGYLVYQGGDLFVVSGTSAASPSFAGIMALIVQKAATRLGNMNPTLYQLGTSQYSGGGTAVFHDVRSGDNTVPGVTGFAAGTGFDLVTGLGSVNGNSLIAATIALLPAVSVGDVSVVEGNAGTTTPATFTVTLSRPSGGTVTVRYATANGTAAAPVDYQASSGTLTFAPGVTSQTVTVMVKGDTLYENDETFFLNLSAATRAVIADGRGQATILNDDPPPGISIDDPAPVTEGNVGYKRVAFTVELSTVSGAATTVTYGTQDGTATGAAGVGQDYLPATGTLTIPAGALKGTIYVWVRGDWNIEPDETFAVNLLSATGATIGKAQGVATVLNDDVPGTVQLGAPRFTVSERAGIAWIKVVRTGGSAAGTTVDYTTVDGTATQPSDYAMTHGTLTFGPGVTTAYFSIPIVRDTLAEGPETVLVSLDNAQPAIFGAALGAQSTAVLTIVDDDIGGRIRFATPAYSVDAHAAAGTATLTVYRTGGLASPVTVHYATADGTAAAGTDYTDTSGDLTFLSSGWGAIRQTITVPVAQDLQGAKTFTVTLTAPMGGASLTAPAAATVTVLGAEPTLAFSAATYDVKTTQPYVLITVRRSAPLSGLVTVPYATSGVTAIPGTDYKDVSGTLTFGPYVTARGFYVPVIKNAFVEAQKTVGVSLGPPTWSAGTAVLDPVLNAATLRITDPNAPPTLQFSAATYTVNEATPKATITVRRTGDPVGTLMVNYDVAAGGTAVNGVDYTLVPGTLTFGPGRTLQTFTIAIVNDTLDEGTRTANLALSAPTWDGGTAVLGTLGTAVLNITDNEPTVQFTAASYLVGEVSRAAYIGVRRTGSLADTATVGYAVTGGTATGGGVDYTLDPGTLTFLPGQYLKVIPIALDPDTVAEGNETIDLELLGPSGVALGTPSTTVLTIKDNDVAGKAQFSATDYGVAEGEGSVTITVTRTGGSSSQATVDYATADGTGVDGTDYSQTVGTLTFGAGETTKTFSVPILDDGTANPGIDKSVQLTLGNPGNGLVLGTPTAATLWIVKE
jgi:pseudomonalisin